VWLIPLLFMAPWLRAGTVPDRDALLNGVTGIAGPGLPGSLCVFGENAFTVITAQATDAAVEPLVAAARLGEGRVIAFGHEGFFSAEALANEGTEKLLVNALHWSAPRSAGAELRVAASNEAGLAVLRKHGIKVLPFDAKNLTACDVLCLNVNALTSDKNRAAVAAFVLKGGGLLVGGPGWGWQQINPGKTLTADHPGTKLLAAAGIAWTGGTVQKNADRDYEAAQTAPQNTNASQALTFLTDPKEVKNQRAIAQATWTLTQAARALPQDDLILLPRLKKLQHEFAGHTIPTPEKPLKTKTDSLARLVLTLQLEDIKRLPAEKRSAHPAAAAFPGAVSTDAPRVERKVAIDTRVPRWHSTGLYAAPGELITLTLPEGLAERMLRIRLGAHTDSIAHHDSWSRAPEISNVWPLNTTATRAANPFGGLIYIDVPEGCTAGTIDMSIQNAVEAPHFVLGKTTRETWRTVRKHAAPWAELETRKVILTVRSDIVRELENPEELMTFWDLVLDGCADLAAIPQERVSPERFVTDVQISAGFMHSGYPIMAPLSVAKALTDKQWMLTKEEPTWGFFHELGHNHQAAAWTFDGTTEVTCNLFTRFVLDTVCGVPVAKQRIQGTEARQALQQHLAGGAKFDEWKAKPFVALIMYDQLQKAFGWETFKKVFAGYNDPANGARPTNDGEERDQWMVRFSRVSGKNLGPFFQAWGVPTSEKARALIANFPAWMPDDFPVK